MKKFLLFITLTFANFQGIHAKEVAQLDNSITIVGGGIIGLFEAYHAYLDAKAKGKRLEPYARAKIEVYKSWKEL